MNVPLPKFRDLPTDYAALVALHAAAPLHSDVDELQVEALIEAMAGHALSDDQEDYLELLADLLLKYQATKHQTPP